MDRLEFLTERDCNGLRRYTHKLQWPWAGKITYAFNVNIYHRNMSDEEVWTSVLYTNISDIRTFW